MVGIIVQLIVSWLIVWLVEKRNLSVLGLFPTKRRLLDFALFFSLTALCCSSEFFLRMLFAKQRWQLNPDLTFNLILNGIWWNVKSVLFEELIFRGVLLYILIKRLGTGAAITISAVSFGIYHWFSHEVFGNPVQMIITFITTGIMGLIYAYGYAKSFSLYIPIAIHLGWNIVRSVVFSDTVIGNQLLVPVKPAPQVTVSYFIFGLVVFFPMLSAILFNFFLLKRYRQVAV